MKTVGVPVSVPTVGDAAAAFDPLSSQGVTWALASGLAAAKSIDGELRGRRHALHDYARQVEAEFSIYLERRRRPLRP